METNAINKTTNKTNDMLYARYDTGGELPPLVLLHGLFADGTQWQKIIEILKDDYRVIVLDMLGHGQSPRPGNATYKPEEHVRYMHNTLMSLHATQRLTLVGYSMGGAVALSYAAAYKKTTEQLYIISTPFYLQPDQMVANKFAASAIFTKSSTKLFSIVESLLRPGKFLNKYLSKGDNSQTFHKMIGAYDNTLDARVIRKSIQELVRQFDFCGTLADITAPVTFYAGKKDPFIVQSQLYALKKYNPYIDIERLNIIKIDHMLVQNLPKEISDLIRKNKINTLHINYDKGHGNPLILLHGIESSSSYWDGITDELADQRRVITIDLLGFGQSPKPLNIAYNINDHVQWLERTIESLQIASFELAGHSLGSIISLAYARKNPNRVSKLTLLSPVLLDENTQSNNIIINNLRYFYHFSDTSYLYLQTTNAIGEDRLRSLVPTVRCIENTIKNQHPFKQIKALKDMPIIFVTGSKDRLLDCEFLEHLTQHSANHQLITIPDATHNFPLYMPKMAFQLLGGTNDKATFKKSAAPHSFAKHIVRLAAPTLLLKSLFYFAMGLLLLTEYASYVLVIGLVLYVMKKSFEIVQGAFTLRYEGVTYVGYLLIAVFGVLASIGLLRDPELAITISVYFISGVAFLTGLIRLITAHYWSTTKLHRRSLQASGSALLVLGLTALAGSVYSVKAITLVIAIVLIARGIQLGTYTVGVFIMAYIRGFGRET